MYSNFNCSVKSTNNHKQFSSMIEKAYIHRKSEITILDILIWEESYIHESILFGFPGSSDNAVAINYYILYAKHYIYLEKLKEENKKREFNIDFLGYLCHLKYIFKIEKSICNRKNQITKFDKFKYNIWKPITWFFVYL